MADVNTVDLRDFIEREMKARGMNATQFAEFIGVAHTTINRARTGTRHDLLQHTPAALRRRTRQARPSGAETTFRTERRASDAAQPLRRTGDLRQMPLFCRLPV